MVDYHDHGDDDDNDDDDDHGDDDDHNHDGYFIITVYLAYRGHE